MAEPTAPSGNALPQESHGTPAAVQQAMVSVNISVQLSEISGDIGRLKEAVDNLKATAVTHTSDLNSVKRTIHIATGFIACGSLLLALIAWLVDTGVDRIFEVLTKT